MRAKCHAGLAFGLGLSLSYKPKWGWHKSEDIFSSQWLAVSVHHAICHHDTVHCAFAAPIQGQSSAE